MYIEFCKCNRLLLTTEQMREKKLCDVCQQEQHAKDFPKRFEELGEEGKNVQVADQRLANNLFSLEVC